MKRKFNVQRGTASLTAQQQTQQEVLDLWQIIDNQLGAFAHEGSWRLRAPELLTNATFVATLLNGYTAIQSELEKLAANEQRSERIGWLFTLVSFMNCLLSALWIADSGTTWLTVPVAVVSLTALLGATSHVYRAKGVQAMVKTLQLRCKSEGFALTETSSREYPQAP